MCECEMHKAFCSSEDAAASLFEIAFSMAWAAEKDP